jgi:hypothetical protein
MGTRVAGCLALVLLLPGLRLPAAASDVQALESDQALPGCGICYPGGYDFNTVGSLRGTVVELQFRDQGPVRFTVEGQGERWVVLASPAWHWRTTGLRLIAGSTVTVRGSKALGSDGTLYLVAEEISPGGGAAAAVLRDGRGRPLWLGVLRGGVNHEDGREAGRGRTSGACRP